MMSLFRKFLVVFAIFQGGIIFASEGEHGAVSTKAEALFSIPLFNGIEIPVTNSILTAWLVAGLLLLFWKVVVGKPKAVPSKFQLVVEVILDAFRDLIEPIVGKKVFPTIFPLLVCFFFFILFQNWAGLIPGVGTIKIGEVSLFRPLGADANGTAALAIISFVAWAIIIIRFVGMKGVFLDWFGNKAKKSDVPVLIYYFLGIIFAAVGIIEVVSIVFRPISLSLRLFGNVLGGEMLLHSTSYFFLFYFLEFIVGIVQALVFVILSAVYIGLITGHTDEEHAVS